MPANAQVQSGGKIGGIQFPKRTAESLIEREELCASVDGAAQEDRETLAGFSFPIR
jgi:hypothetical protein